MGLFGAQKATSQTVQEVGHMVQHYFQERGLNYHHQEIPGAEGCGWWLKEGSAKVYIFIQDSPAGPVLRITSPLVFIPEQNKEVFYRRLLDLNSSLTNCLLATYENYVLVISQRQTLGLIQEELDAGIWNVAYIADLLDNMLSAEFNTPLYHD